MTSLVEALQSGWLWSALVIVAAVALMWFAARLWLWLLVGVPLLLGLTLLSGVAPGGWIAAWLIFAAGVLVFGVPAVRTRLISEGLFRLMRQSLPALPRSERETLAAGVSGWERSLFLGRPDWRALRRAGSDLHLDEREREIVDGPVEAFCAALDDYRINHEFHDLPPEAWAVLQRERLFGLALTTAEGGLGLSPCALSAALMKIASRSQSAAWILAVPGWAGAVRLLERYGTEEQRRRYLPAIAAGEELACVAVTGPEAGSDTASITDHGRVCRRGHGGESEVLGVSLSFDKRYITLAPTASLLIVAFKLDDPDRLIQAPPRGITLALIPAGAPGVRRGARHDVRQLGIPTGPVGGDDVFVPLGAILGGVDGIGRGWTMLAACAAEVNGLVIPALSCATAKMAAGLAGAYARVRYQFHEPLARFEGVQEALADIAGHAFAMDATRQFLLAEMAAGEPPAVAAAVAKYSLSERCRSVVERALDIYAGAGVCLGPRNLLGEIARFPAIGIAAQGANLLTRSRTIFGLGVIRCHPCLRHEIDAIALRGREALVAFDRAVARHLRYATSSLVRTFLLGLTGGRLAAAPRGSRPNGRYYRQLARLAAGFALTTDVVLFTLREELTRRQRLTGRMADVLSELYIASAALRHHALTGGRETGDHALLDWTLRHSLGRAEAALEGVCRNLPAPAIGRVLRRLLFPLGRARRPANDDAEARIATMLTVPSTARDRLTAGIYRPLAKDEPLTRLEAALSKLAMTADLEAKLRAGAALELLGAGRFEQRIERAVARRLLSPSEAEELLAAEAARREALRVDEFGPSGEDASDDE